PPGRPAKPPRHGAQGVGWRPVSCRKRPAAQAPSVSTFHSIAVHNKRIAAQLPPQMPTERLRPITSGRSHARSSIPRILPVAAAVSASMVRNALSATALKLLPSTFSSRAAVVSISARSFSSRRWSLEAKSPWFEVMLVQRSLHPPPFPVVRIPDGQVALALAPHLKAGFLEGGDDVGAALHGAVLDALCQVVPD
ncbi:MAG: hypothetical protein OXF93_10585, partial [Acidobacteria bacterium]|nr:hypothetical protein [Acidobacteriota bacterium]